MSGNVVKKREEIRYDVEIQFVNLTPKLAETKTANICRILQGAAKRCNIAMSRIEFVG